MGKLGYMIMISKSCKLLLMRSRKIFATELLDFISDTAQGNLCVHGGSECDDHKTIYIAPQINIITQIMRICLGGG